MPLGAALLAVDHLGRVACCTGKFKHLLALLQRLAGRRLSHRQRRGELVRGELALALVPLRGLVPGGRGGLLPLAHRLVLRHLHLVQVRHGKLMPIAHVRHDGRHEIVGVDASPEPAVHARPGSRNKSTDVDLDQALTELN